MSADASAIDLPRVDKKPVTLDVTETSIVAQRFAARDGERPEDQGYFAWLNRLNMQLGWWRLSVGARLDSSFYLLRPQDADGLSAQDRRARVIDGTTRYRDRLYPAKVWATYKAPGIEVTVGDSYAQFGRGLVLSLRKVDELGIDTTVLGAKVAITKDPFAFTAIAGVANPSRVDEPSGRALFFPVGLTTDARGPQPIFGSDRIVGAQVQAGRGLPVVLSTHVVNVTKCAPYAYDSRGFVQGTGLFDSPFGSCADSDRRFWLDSLPKLGPVLAFDETTNLGQSIEVPNLWKHGNLYLEAATQHHGGPSGDRAGGQGNALYGSLVTNIGKVTDTLEVKSYRNFYPLAGSVNATRASAFGNIAYSAPPTAEPIIQDSMFGFFNACVTGGKNRVDVRVTEPLLVYGEGAFFRTQSEVIGGGCDAFGRSTADDKDGTTNNVFQGIGGVQYRFDKDRSIVFANVLYRNDRTAAGDLYYRETAFQYSITKYIAGPYAIELAGRHRFREQENENLRGAGFVQEPWWQGEHQNALKIAPKWILSQGFEYTTLVGLPTYYLNGGVVYRFTTESNIRLYVGQNRGGLRCVSGICRIFPAFSGARAELTLRF